MGNVSENQINSSIDISSNNNSENLNETHFDLNSNSVNENETPTTSDSTSFQTITNSKKLPTNSNEKKNIHPVQLALMYLEEAIGTKKKILCIV